MCMLLPCECQCMFAKSVNRMQIVSVEDSDYSMVKWYIGKSLSKQLMKEQCKETTAKPAKM